MAIKHRVQAAGTPEEQVWDLSELQGKKLDWEGARKFLDKLPQLEKKSWISYVVKPGIKFNMAKLISLLNAMHPSIEAHKWPGKSREFMVDFNENYPVEGKVVFAPKLGKKTPEERKKQDEEFAKKCEELRNAKKAKGIQWGWYMDKTTMNGAFMTILGEFLEGPNKGRPFACQYNPSKQIKVGEVIKVKAGSTYGDVRRVD